MSVASLNAELARNFNQFAREAINESEAVRNALRVEDQKYLESFKMLCAFRAFHDSIVAGESDDAQGFYIEAHNDLLTAHVHATNGMWRSSFKSLRSFLENFLSFLYYKDHPIELQLWKTGKFRIGAAELRKYVSAHPLVVNSSLAKSAVDSIESDYAKLSISVHASRVDYRMTAQNAYPSLSSASKVSLGQWLSQERSVIRLAIVLMLVIYQKQLRGAGSRGLRTIAGLVLSADKKARVMTELAIRLQ